MLAPVVKQVNLKFKHILNYLFLLNAFKTFRYYNAIQLYMNIEKSQVKEVC